MEERRTEIYVLSCERYETLALCLAGLCGHNPGRPIHVIDDASMDPRVAGLLWEYKNRGLIDTMERMPARSGVGVTRHQMVQRFLESGADTLVQVEGDMLLGPGVVEGLLAAWTFARERQHDIHWLCAHQHDWAHAETERRVLGEYIFSWARSGSEPFWMTSRTALVDFGHLITPHAPDLCAYLRAVGATVLRSPELPVQHMGAINSFYYGHFGPQWVTYHNADGAIRQPYPALFQIEFPEVPNGPGNNEKPVLCGLNCYIPHGRPVVPDVIRREWEERYLQWAQAVADAAPVKLPEA